MLMESKSRFIIVFVTLCCLCSSRVIHAMVSHNRHFLDDLIQDLAPNSVPTPPNMGILYNVPLPSNFTGIEVSVVRLLSTSFWARGVNLSYFDIPPRIMPQPFLPTLDIVYSNLGNWSTYYYNLQNYTLVTPVLGFYTYGSITSYGQIGNSSTPTTKLNLTLVKDPILVRFPQFSLPDTQNAKCVMFYSNGTTEMTNMTLPGTCVVRDQGHFLIAMQVPPLSPVGPKDKEEREKWWVGGIVVGVGLMLFGFVLFMVIRFVRMRNIGKMEKQSERNEALDTTYVGRSRMPYASGVRTQPVLESDYFP